MAHGAVEVQLTSPYGDKHDPFTIWLLRRWQHLEDVLNVLQKPCQETTEEVMLLVW